LRRHRREARGSSRGEHQSSGDGVWRECVGGGDSRGLDVFARVIARFGAGARLVIQRNTVDYLAPITADFEAECPAVTSEELARVVKMLSRHG